jgi:hypothetical protein
MLGNILARPECTGETQLDSIGAVIGIADRQILRDLQSFGYDTKTVNSLRVMPLVQVAWSDGSVDGMEREYIFEIARRYGMDQGHPAWIRLAQSLDVRPAAELFAITLRALQASLRALPDSGRERRRRELVAQCTAVAAASGRLWGFGSGISEAELLTINEIVNALRTD